MGPMRDTRANPEVAVLIPLEDPRGDVLDHLRTWTRAQTLSRERFQVVLGADGQHPEFERQAASELAPGDEIVTVPGASLMGLYDACARAATAPVLVFTEAHVRADPSCLAVVTEAISSDPALDGATLRHVQSATTGISPLSERWFARSFEEWDRAGWVRLNTTGVAIAREAYDRAGRIDERLGLYAPSLLSARLDQQGARIRHLDDAIVTHELEVEMGFSLELGADFARGECLVRREQDPEFCERYFGPAGIWERRFAYRKEVAGPMVAALRVAIRMSPGDRRWLTRELVARAPARVAGTRPRRAWEWATTRAHQAVAATPVLPNAARWRSYVAAQHGTVRTVQLDELEAENGMPPPLVAGGRPIGAERLDGVLVGSYGTEAVDGRGFRWTEPVTLLRVDTAGMEAVVRIDTAGLRGEDPISYLQGVFAGSEQLPPEAITGGGGVLEIRLPAGLADRAGHGLVVICRPLVESRDGSADGRRLGMPVAQVQLSPA